MECNKRQKLFLVIGSLFSIIIGIGMAYAFFNYNNTGDSNTLRLGAMEFSSNYTSVTLQNIFPISSSDVGMDTTNVATVVVTVNGSTKYEEGIEYLVSFKDVDNIAVNQVIPISLMVDVSNGLGTEDNSYFTNRGSTNKVYQVLADDTIYSGEYVVVGYIPASTNATNGTITLKAYVDENKVTISDVYDRLETDELGIMDNWDEDMVVISTDEWDNILTSALSFKIKLEAKEGIWVTEPVNFYDLIEGKTETAPTYVKSYTTTVINNGYSTFTTQDTVEENNNKEEVYYYTGSDAITNGNVLFAGYCWQIVRTTDNGGVRLIYNGISENNQCMDSRSSNTYLGVQSEHENIWIESAYLYGDSYDYDLTTGKFSLVSPESTTRTWSLATYESFMGKYTCKNTTGINCDNVWYVGKYHWNSSNNYVEAIKYRIDNITNYRIMGKSGYNAGFSSVSNVGYMYKNIYSPKSGMTVGAVYGRDVEYNNGEYLVIDSTPGVASANSNTTLNENYHYTCGILDDNDEPITTCEVVRYYYRVSGSDYYYIELSGGEKVEDALKNMLNYKSVGDNTDVDINLYSSSIKDYLEIWYDKNLKDYEKYIDTDAVYCDSRKVKNLGGWDSEGGLLSEALTFKYFSQSTDLACESIYDRFSKENSKARIRNPIGLITEPERGLMGNAYAQIGDTYFISGAYRYELSYAYSRLVYPLGTANYYAVHVASGVRGAITLKPNTVIYEGNGLASSPYQIGPLVTRNN